MQCATMPPPRYVVLLPVGGSVLIFGGFQGLLMKSRSQLRGTTCALAVPAKAHENIAARNHVALLTAWGAALLAALSTTLWPGRGQQAPSILLSQFPSCRSESGCSSCWG